MILTATHDEFRRTVQRFVAEHINPHIDEWEQQGIFPAKTLFRQAGELGLLGIDKPEAYGGLGLDYSYQAVFAEEIGSALHGSTPMALGVQTTMATPALAKHGSDELRRQFLAPAISGELVTSIAVSEAGAGSDVAALKTSARKQGGDYVINGSKMWITNSTQADYLCLLANTGDGPAHKNKSLIIVPTSCAGIRFSDRIDKLGMRASDTAEIYFDNVRVPQSHLIGVENLGFIHQMEQFQEERMWVGLSSLKMMEACINHTIDYTRERKIFGRSVLDNQVIHYRLAELQTEVEALRALCYRGVEQMVAGQDISLIASMVKLKTGRLTGEVTSGCLQYWGGMGFTWDNVVSRAFRDSRLSAIGGGSDETMLAIISKMMGTHP
ncbi:acyl-CoA dehydrogenase family protein [uncultured Ferrimonas sp.]|uniref:acyl-CoA dehydrogenase family protein n=1 Tax=uncultured Ferrimonas sp. TaxID=432640 RepID=UPI0026091C4C|nr:acyl-CoA dehydrogenase family protein [uncultured Ferrimonas sp.]